jgi:hypothetical protein
MRFLSLFLAAVCLFADIANYPVSIGGSMRAKPQAVPTTLTTVTSYDSLLDQLTISNTTAGSITVTVQDRQASPVAVLAAPIAAGTTYVISFPKGYLCPGGFAVQASGAGATFQAEWRQ